jgi:hypothetical protein
VTTAKESLRRLLPAPVFRAVSGALDRTLPSRRRNLWWQRQQRVIAALIDEHGPVVQSGPFQGLRLPVTSAWGNLAPLLVGSYEGELHSAVNELIAAAPERVVNVGSAEGYYAVGFALRLPGAEIYAFDINDDAQELTRETGRMNGVTERLHVAAECTVEGLDRLLTPRTVVVMDCEGCELELLRPDRAPALSQATVLVEFHDFIEPGISSAISERFAGSHSIQVIAAEERVAADYPALAKLTPRERTIALNEWRTLGLHPMQWGVLRPLASAR